MVGSLYSGISGIRTHQFGLDSTSNNIANINTVGYRANLPEFKSLFSRSMDYVNANSPIRNDYNYGSTIGSNAINTNDGTYVSSDGTFNVAITGRSWFVVGLNKEGQFDINNPLAQPDQRNYFTRDGSFSLDGEGYLVNSSGYYMYGINLGKIQDNVITGTNNFAQDYVDLGGSVLQPLRIPKDLQYQPTLTTDVHISVNLNRTQNPKGIGILKDDEGNFSEEKFLNQDLNALMDGSGKLLDAKNYKDIKFVLTNEEGEEQEFNFVYGEDFRTIGELADLIKNTTGFDFGLRFDANGNPIDCSMRLVNNTGESYKVEISGKLADKLGMKTLGKNLQTPNDSINTTQFNIPTYESNTEIFNADGEKFILKNQFILVEQGDYSVEPPVSERWEIVSGIYDITGTTMISDAPVRSEISFNADNTPNVAPFNVPFAGGTIAVDLSQSQEGRMTSNYAYADSEVKGVVQDGCASGIVSDYTITEDGIIMVHFTNGKLEPIGRFGLAAFINDQGLSKIGGNLFSMNVRVINGETNFVSGPPLLAWDDTGNANLKYAQILSQMLETSNVDAGTALTDLIVYQRGYQMAAKAITTSDQLMQEAIQLKRN